MNESNMPDFPLEDDEESSLTAQQLLELQELEASLTAQEACQGESNELSFAEIYSSVLLSGEIIITIPAELESKVKQGLKNFKAKQATKNKEQGLPIDNNVLSFNAKPSDISNAVDLSISLLSRNLIPILRIKIPDQEF